MLASVKKTFEEKLFHFFEQDCDLSELLINGSRSMELRSLSSSEYQDSLFSSSDELLDFCYEFAEGLETRLDFQCPANGGLCFDGRFRWHAMIPPLSQQGPYLCIRRLRFGQLSLSSFAMNAADRDGALQAIKRQQPIIVFGAPGVGKTSFMVSLLRECCKAQRVVILEKISEINQIEAPWLHLVESHVNVAGRGAYNLEQIFSQTLRMMPERYVIGEIRQEEAALFFRCLEVGFGGVMTSIHAQSIDQVVERFGSLVPGIDVRRVFRDFEVRFIKVEKATPPRIRYQQLAANN